MDTGNLSIDLKSVAGIVTLTILLVNYLKGWLGQQPVLKRIPVAVYVVLVSTVLTFLVHQFTLITGDTGSLLVQALGQALAASGVLEWLRAGFKPTEATAAAQEESASTSVKYLIPILIAVGLSASACSAHVPPVIVAQLVEADDKIHDSIKSTVDQGNKHCDSHLLSPATCAQLNAKLIPVIEQADRYNRALRKKTTAEVPTMISALANLSADVGNLFSTAADDLAILKQKIADALTSLRAIPRN